MLKHYMRILPSFYGKWILTPGSISLVYYDQLDHSGCLNVEMEDFFKKEILRSQLNNSNRFHLTILTTTDCNLGCNYCFQNIFLNPDNPFHPERIAKTFLSTSTIKEIIHFCKKRMELANLDDSALTIFGGEPLLNKSGCLELINASKDINCKFISMITNGSLLKPELATELSLSGLQSIQVTLDGNRIQHNQTRFNHAGLGTFDSILENLKFITDNNLFKVSIRVNVSIHNIDSLQELLDQLSEKINPTKCSLYFAWIGDTGIGYDNYLENSSYIINSLTTLNITAYEKNFIFTPPKLSLCNTCGTKATNKAAVINSDGKLYSCWNSAGHKNMDIGTITEGFYPSEIINKRWTRCGEQYINNKENNYSTILNETDGKFLDYLKDNTNYFFE